MMRTAGGRTRHSIGKRDRSSGNIGARAQGLLVVAVALVVLVVQPVGATETPSVSLAVGESAFWDGSFIASAGPALRAADATVCRGPTASTYTCAASTASLPAYALWTGNRSGLDIPVCGAAVECIDYPIDVAAGAARLRVALDHPSGRDSFGLELYAPDGAFVTSNAPFANQLTVEVYAPDPVPGTWVAKAVPYDVVGSGFRMRARLDPTLPPSGPARPLLPNLHVGAPFEIGFAGCQASEIAQHAARRCLRFSIGPQNTGDGPLELVIKEAASLSGTNYQRIHLSDGSVQDREAGRYEWHAAHGHYHHVAIGGFELFAVDDPSTGAMHLTAPGPKQGFCIVEQVVIDWWSFEQDEQWSATGSCTAIVDPPIGTRMGLTRGWGDVYPYFVEGNFVDFGDNPDGLYVIRATSDPTDDILETDETDNTAYAYIDVTGNQVQVLERGRGQDPWDPEKELVDDTRPPTL